MPCSASAAMKTAPPTSSQAGSPSTGETEVVARTPTHASANGSATMTVAATLAMRFAACSMPGR